MGSGSGLPRDRARIAAKRQADSLAESTPASYKKAGVKLVHPGTLSKSVSDAMRGKAVRPGEINAAKQYDIASANKMAITGKMDHQSYQSRIKEINVRYSEEAYGRTMEFGRVAQVQGDSIRMGDAERRSVKGIQGIAVGTINPDGTNSSSKGGVISSDGRFDRITESRTINRTKSETKPETNPVQGPVKPNFAYSVELKEGGVGDKITPVGSLEYLYGGPAKIYDDKKYDNLGQAAYAGFGNALRYSDIVDRGELPKPQGLEWLGYYASRGLRPLYNIPLSLMDDKTMQPSLSSTIIDVPIDLVTKGKTKTHDPIGDYIRADPLGTALELPAEAALFATGALAIRAGSKVFTRYSPITFQSKKILTESGGKPETIYRGITFRDKPVIGVQQRKIVKGFDAGKVATSFGKVKTESLGRDGIEAGLGSGVEAELIYSERTLSTLVARGIIPEIGKARALQSKVITRKGVKITSQTGSFGETPIEGLTQKQSDVIFKGVVKGQASKDIDTVHGSAALKPQLGEQITKEAGSSVKLGDVDIHPTGLTLKIKAVKADRLIQGFAADFPLSPGQRLSISGVGKGETVNRGLELSGGSLKEPKKILEVVLKGDEESKYGIGQGSKVLGERIPFKKSVTAKDIAVKLHTADYQLLTNIKQVTSFQKGTDTLLDVYPSSGRTKDIVRAYWNVKAKALFKGGTEGGDLNREAEKFRKLYPGIEFTDFKGEKVLLSSSRITEPSSKLSYGKPSPLKSITPKAESKEPPSVKPSSRTSIKLSSRILQSIKPTVVTSSLTSKIPSRKSQSGKPSNSIRTDIPSILSTLKTPLTISPSIKPPSLKIPPKTPVGTPLTRPLSITPRTKRMLRHTIRPKAGVLWITIKNTTKTTIGDKKRTYNFLGNTKTSEITGFRTKKSDITVGDKRTAQLYSEDVKKSKRGYRKSDKKNMLSIRGSSKFSLI